MSVTIVLPERSEDEISEGLRALTKALHGAGIDVTGWGLGGENGYGANYENDVFMMHRFCWCERETCPWCRDESPEPNFRHKASGTTVHWYKWIGRSMEIEMLPQVDWATILRACIDSIPARAP